MGIVTLVVGIVMFFMAVRKQQKATSGILICPQCEAVVASTVVGNELCPECGAVMVPLEGFYDRHPELKTKA
jgi:hypothetical protein